MTTLAADIGGTRIKLGLVKDRALIASRVLHARSHEGLELQLPRIATAFDSLCSESGVGYPDCRGLGIAFPSVIDVSTGRVLDAYGKYADAPQIDLQAWGRQQFGLPVAVENDARVAQLGEWLAGAGQGCDDFVMVTLGTGIGTSALIGRQLVRGKHGQAAILGGHTTIRYDGKQCVCGNRGCAETEASTASLIELARGHSQFASSSLQSAEAIDYASIFQLARTGDACAAALRAHSIQVWAAVIVSLIHSFDPDRVVVGGGIAADAPDFMEELDQRVQSLAHTPWGKVDIVPARLGNAAALIGAAVLIEERGL